MALQPGDIPTGSISMLNYNKINNNVELYGVNFQSQTLVPIMTANMNLYVDTQIGSDTLYDGTSATIVGSHGPFKTIMKAINVTFSYGASVYTMTIHVAAGTYPEAVSNPPIPGPGVVITGAGRNQTVVTGADNSHTFSITGPAHIQVKNLTSTAVHVGSGPPCCFASSGNGVLYVTDCASGSAPNCYIFSGWGGQTFVTSSHVFNSGSQTLAAFAAYMNGLIGIGENCAFTFGGPFYCQEFVATSTGGIWESGVPGAPSWTNAGYVQGFNGVGCYKFGAWVNGVVFTEGQSSSWLPGNLPGLLGTGGQFA
jgi:hypothetical protein